MTSFEVGKKYYGRLSPKGFYKICVGIYDGRPILLAPGSRDLHWLATHVLDEWKEYKEPITVEGWVNIYAPPLFGIVSLHPTLKKAEVTAQAMRRSAPARRLVATVFVKGTSDEN